jgi:hypothetical protein
MMLAHTRTYRITVQGHLNQTGYDWLEGAIIQHTPTGETMITTSAIDQSALNALLNGLHRLAVTLLSVQSVSPSGLGL